MKVPVLKNPPSEASEVFNLDEIEQRITNAPKALQEGLWLHLAVVSATSCLSALKSLYGHPGAIKRSPIVYTRPFLDRKSERFGSKST
jgi:hypothetical protein